MLFMPLFTLVLGWSSQSSLLIRVQTGCSSNTLVSSQRNALRSYVNMKQGYPLLLVNRGSAARPAEHKTSSLVTLTH
jgi:hypothetical protein